MNEFDCHWTSAVWGALIGLAGAFAVSMAVCAVAHFLGYLLLQVLP